MQNEVQTSVGAAMTDRRQPAEGVDEDLRSAIYSELQGDTQLRNHVTDRILAAISPWLRGLQGPSDALLEFAKTYADSPCGFDKYGPKKLDCPCSSCTATRAILRWEGKP